LQFFSGVGHIASKETFTGLTENSVQIKRKSKTLFQTDWAKMGFVWCRSAAQEKTPGQRKLAPSRF